MKKPIDPDNSDIRGLIAEIEMCLAALKRKLAIVPDPALKRQIVASSSAFGRTSCANQPLRSTTAPAAPVVHPQLRSLLLRVYRNIYKHVPASSTVEVFRLFRFLFICSRSHRALRNGDDLAIAVRQGFNHKAP